MIGINLVCCVLLTQRQWIVINATVSVSRCDEVPVSLYLIMGQWQWKINYKLFSVLTWPHCAPPPAPPTGLWLHSSISSHTQSNQQLDIILIQFCPINKFILFKDKWTFFPSQNSTTHNDQNPQLQGSPLHGSVTAISGGCDQWQSATAQWAKSGFFVQWVYWVYLFSQNTRPLCNAAMYEQV